jgi:hypothetical protein
LGLPYLNAIPGRQDVAKDALIVDPGAVGAVAIVQDPLSLLPREGSMMAGNHQLIAQNHIVIELATYGKSL